MNIDVTFAQAVAVKGALGAQAIVLYFTDVTGTLVNGLAILDAKSGQIHFSWGSPADFPTVATFLVNFPGAVQVAGITG